MSITELEGHQKDELVCSLAALVCHDSGAEFSAENLKAAVEASGNSIAPYWIPIFSSLLAKVPDVNDLLAGPGAGGAPAAAGAPAAGGAAAAAPAEEEEEEEAEEVDLGGGMDMFGGGGDDY